jgi:hypothetical protein
VLHWLATASFVRGELAQSVDALSAAARLAETSTNRAALLNLLRGTAMCFVLLGRAVEAHEEAERAVELFNLSNEAERLAAQAGGQNPGAANMAGNVLGSLGARSGRCGSSTDRCCPETG